MKAAVIKFVFRWAFRLLILAIVLVIAVVLLKDTVAKSVAEQRIRRETGFDAKIGKLEVGLLSPQISIENFVLYNPAEFGGSPFLSIPDLHLEYNPDELAFHRLRLKLLRLDLKELNIVENMNGRTNIVDLLAHVSPETIGHSNGKTNRDVQFSGIDMLNLSVGTVRYVNLRKPQRNQEFNLALKNEIVQNVRSEEDMAGILFKILLRAGITIYLDHNTPKHTNQVRAANG
jgi:hypothetical protein